MVPRERSNKNSDTYKHNDESNIEEQQGHPQHGSSLLEDRDSVPLCEQYVSRPIGVEENTDQQDKLLDLEQNVEMSVVVPSHIEEAAGLQSEPGETSSPASSGSKRMSRQPKSVVGARGIRVQKESRGGEGMSKRKKPRTIYEHLSYDQIQEKGMIGEFSISEGTQLRSPPASSLKASLSGQQVSHVSQVPQFQHSAVPSSQLQNTYYLQQHSQQLSRGSISGQQSQTSQQISGAPRGEPSGSQQQQNLSPQQLSMVSYGQVKNMFQSQPELDQSLISPQQQPQPQPPYMQSSPPQLQPGPPGPAVPQYAPQGYSYQLMIPRLPYGVDPSTAAQYFRLSSVPFGQFPPGTQYAYFPSPEQLRQPRLRERGTFEGRSYSTPRRKGKGVTRGSSRSPAGSSKGKTRSRTQPIAGMVNLGKFNEWGNEDVDAFTKGPMQGTFFTPTIAAPPPAPAHEQQLSQPVLPRPELPPPPSSAAAVVTAGVGATGAETSLRVPPGGSGRMSSSSMVLSKTPGDKSQSSKLGSPLQIQKEEKKRETTPRVARTQEDQKEEHEASQPTVTPKRASEIPSVSPMSIIQVPVQPSFVSADRLQQQPSQQPSQPTAITSQTNFMVTVSEDMPSLLPSAGSTSQMLGSPLVPVGRGSYEGGNVVVPIGPGMTIPGPFPVMPIGVSLAMAMSMGPGSASITGTVGVPPPQAPQIPQTFQAPQASQALPPTQQQHHYNYPPHHLHHHYNQHHQESSFIRPGGMGEAIPGIGIPLSIESGIPSQTGGAAGSGGNYGYQAGPYVYSQYSYPYPYQYPVAPVPQQPQQPEIAAMGQYGSGIVEWPYSSTQFQLSAEQIQFQQQQQQQQAPQGEATGEESTDSRHSNYLEDPKRQ